jgi:hypothetical protein
MMMSRAQEEVEIDHVVALKDAFISGSWAWDFQTRCLYANFLGFERHLLAVSSSENKTKSDKTPEEWMPTDSRYACQHLQNWLVIKLIWKLNMGSSEAQAIALELKRNHCQVQEMQFSRTEISRIRQFAISNLDLCPQHNSFETDLAKSAD